MTMPCERTRALIQTGEWLESIRLDPNQSVENKNAAMHLLRHYPSRREILLEGKKQEYLISQTQLVFNQFLSSSTE